MSHTLLHGYFIVNPIQNMIYVCFFSITAPYERSLINHGWMPFGIQRFDVGPEGGSITLQSKADSRRRFKKGDVIQLEVPKDAVRKQGGGKMPIRYGILMNGKFKLKAGYKLVSPVVYVSYDPKDTTKPFELQIPHWASDEDVFIATSPQGNNEVGDVIMLNLKYGMVSSSSRNAAVSSISGSELYAVAVREGAKSNFYAIPLESPLTHGRGVELSVIISYASSVWCEVSVQFHSVYVACHIPFPHVHHKAGRTRVDLNRVRPAFDPISVHMGIARFPYCVNI